MKWNVFDPTCPTRALLDRIGDKWTVLIVCALGDGPLRFGELKRAIGGPAPKVLTAVLRSLEGDGMVTRTVYATSPVRVEYALTPLGRSLGVVVDGMREWAEKSMDKVARARARRQLATASQAR
jgi:DNA-binding HxlR family transcriptional regulator